MADKKEISTQIAERQHDAGMVLPEDVAKYGMDRATQKIWEGWTNTYKKSQLSEWGLTEASFATKYE